MATKKKATKKKSPAAGAIVLPEVNVPQKHRLQLHNITNKVVNWTVAGSGGIKERGTMPGMASSTVRVNHAKSYKVTMWSDPAKKLSERCPPHGEAIFTGRKIACTTPL